MSLQNLLKIGQLEAYETDATQVRRMLQPVARSVADARQAPISPETRLDAGYRAITQQSLRMACRQQSGTDRVSVYSSREKLA